MGSLSKWMRLAAVCPILNWEHSDCGRKSCNCQPKFLHWAVSSTHYKLTNHHLDEWHHTDILKCAPPPVLIGKQLKSISYLLARRKLKGKNRRHKFCFCYWIVSHAKLLISLQVQRTKLLIKCWRAVMNAFIVLMHSFFYYVQCIYWLSKTEITYVCGYKTKLHSNHVSPFFPSHIFHSISI